METLSGGAAALGHEALLGERRAERPRLARRADISGYRSRGKIERTFTWPGNFRRLWVRWERLSVLYHLFLTMAGLLIIPDEVLQWLLAW
jgi:hypothetical protein